MLFVDIGKLILKVNEKSKEYRQNIFEKEQQSLKIHNS